MGEPLAAPAHPPDRADGPTGVDVGMIRTKTGRRVHS
jgi:hypothetical protein